MLHLPPPLAPLAAYRQFMVYKLVPKPDKPGKMDKFPVSVFTGDVVNAHDAAHWTDSQTAITIAELFGPSYGVAFVFTAADPFWFLDIDNCAMGGTWSPVAMQLCEALNGAAVEVSQSGTGLHVIGSGRAPEHGCKNTALGLEFYTEGRFVALTGDRAVGNAAVDFTGALPAIVERYFPPRETVRGADWTLVPVPEWSGPEDDDALIARAMAAQSAGSVFGHRASFADLFTGNVEALARAYPMEGRPYDASSADAALAQHLAFWTGNNCERIARIMQRSALKRDKWDYHKQYVHMTVTRAVSMQTRVYQQRKKDAPPAEMSPGVQPAPVMRDGKDGPEFAQGLQFLAPTQQVDYFAGCVYIQKLHRVFTPSGDILKPEQFKSTYGGYLFAMDAANTKTSRNAWEVFTESQAIRFPKVQDTCFRPHLPPGEIVKEEGRSAVNVYVPVPTQRNVGDVSKFLTHLAKILPVQRDREILTAYMAACVQFKGTKFKWAPLLQGCEGNGKTLFSECVAFAVGRRYCHMPKAAEIGNKFNAWISNKLFIGVEDIYVPEHKREVMEALKPMITNEYLEVEHKSVDQFTEKICANFILNSNHKDAIRKSRTDRRFAIFYTAQQTDEDLSRDGMLGNYFPDLYDWLRGTGAYSGQPSGFSIVNEYLSTYIIPEDLNPAGLCHRAPKTSTTDEALSLALGSIEQEIKEAIDEGRPGFAGGWVSSMALDRLLEGLRKAGVVPPNRRREMLASMGYVLHPGLPEGRVNNLVPLDGGRPRLYLRKGHPALTMKEPAEIAKAYAVAQFGGVPPGAAP